YYESDWL
nr:Chain C, peptide [synthetic construct]6Q0M_D Chain D, peptide [synthetic construct]